MDNATNSCLLSRQCDDQVGLHAYACVVNRIYGYLILVLGCFGIPTNIVNIAILTHKSMRSPVNNILTGIAISDLITMENGFLVFLSPYLEDVSFIPYKKTHDGPYICTVLTPPRGSSSTAGQPPCC